MIIDKDTLETMQCAAEAVYQLKLKADQDAKETTEAKLAKTLSAKWGRMLQKIDAVKLLLADEPVDNDAA